MADEGMDLRAFRVLADSPPARKSVFNPISRDYGREREKKKRRNVETTLLSRFFSSLHFERSVEELNESMLALFLPGI